MQIDAAVALVDDRVDRHRGLAGLAVADDQLALAAADGNHAVDGLEAGLQRLAHRLAIDDARRDALDGQVGLRGDRPLAVDRLAERVDHAAEHLVADRHRDDAAGALHLVAFLDLLELAEEHRADAVLFEVERDAEDAVRKRDHLAGHGPFDAADARDTVADRHDVADFGHVHVDRIVADLIANDAGDVFSSDVHRWCAVKPRCWLQAPDSGAPGRIPLA